ncbi:MAG: hypothetical protein C0413_03140 [Clostridiales bacterium]|nr:hypothetical protein [Clostridiales bacterium]
MRKHILGKRPNLSAQKSVADEIVSALSVPPEDMPLPPLSPLPPTAPRQPQKKNPQGSSVAATILLFLPFLYPIVFYVHGYVTGHPLPVLLFPLLVLFARLLSNLGGFILFLAARSADYLKKTVGLTALAAFILPFAGSLLFGTTLNRVDPTRISETRDWIALACVALGLFCMLTLCVFSVLMLARVFHRKKTA